MYFVIIHIDFVPILLTSITEDRPACAGRPCTHATMSAAASSRLVRTTVQGSLMSGKLYQTPTSRHDVNIGQHELFHEQVLHQHIPHIFDVMPEVFHHTFQPLPSLYRAEVCKQIHIPPLRRHRHQASTQERHKSRYNARIRTPRLSKRQTQRRAQFRKPIQRDPQKLPLFQLHHLLQYPRE